MYSPIRNCRERFKASMTTSDAETRISRFFLLSEYDMTAGRGANKQEKFFKRIRLGYEAENQ